MRNGAGQTGRHRAAGNPLEPEVVVDQGGSSGPVQGGNSWRSESLQGSWEFRQRPFDGRASGQTSEGIEKRAESKARVLVVWVERRSYGMSNTTLCRGK